MLAGFIMLWLKRCVVPTLPHEVIITNVEYLAVLLAYRKSIALLLAMVAGIQIGLRALAKSFCQVEAIENAEGHPVTKSNGHPLVKTPSPRVKLPYTYLIAWYVMHCPSLMMTVSASEGFTLYVRRLENSGRLRYYMLYIWKTILNGSNYQLDRCP